MPSFFEAVEGDLPIEIYNLNKLFAFDENPLKVNLSIGVYRTEEGSSWVLPVVRKVEGEILARKALAHDYMPTLGNETYTDAAVKLSLGDKFMADPVKSKCAFGIQTLSGTGGLRLGAEFLSRTLNCKTFYTSNPTWHNHKQLFMNSGFVEERKYRYWNSEKRGIDIEGFLDDLEHAPEGSIIVLHACAHNPTGCDPTPTQWTRIAEMMKKKKLFPFFDMAYQGFASGDPDKDAYAVRLFAEMGFELFCAQSFAKNFGLYNDRIGNLTIVTNNPAKVEAIKSRMFILVTMQYLTPPAHGCRIVDTILNDADLRQEWLESMKVMSSRITKMRKMLHDNLIALRTPGSWEHILEQIGMFSYTGLNENQCKLLTEKYSIYLPTSGRINMCGLNEKNVGYVARSISNVLMILNENDDEFYKDADSKLKLLDNVSIKNPQKQQSIS